MPPSLLKRGYRALFANAWSFRLNLFLFDCALSGMGVGNHEDDRVSGERHFVEKILPALLPRERPLVFVDVGANIGGYAALLAGAFTDCAIYAVEPHPASFEHLQRAAATDARIHPLHCGLAAKAGRLPLYDTAGGAGSLHASLYRQAITDLLQEETLPIEVELETLDELMRRRQVEHIDFLKLDTEGAELEVLRGARELLKRGAISVLQFEFNEMNTLSKAFFRDFRQLLEDYSFFRLLPRSMLLFPWWSGYSELFAFQNIVCVRNDLLRALDERSFRRIIPYARFIQRLPEYRAIGR